MTLQTEIILIETANFLLQIFFLILFNVNIANFSAKADNVKLHYPKLAKDYSIINAIQKIFENMHLILYCSDLK